MTPRTRIQSRTTPLRNPERAIGVFLGAAVLVVLLVAPSLRPGTYIPSLTVENPTLFDLTVEVAGRERNGWSDIGTVGRETDEIIEEVGDPGATWVLRFTYAGVEGGEVTIPRSDLRTDGWRLIVPVSVGENLTAAGFPPSVR